MNLSAAVSSRRALLLAFGLAAFAAAALAPVFAADDNPAPPIRIAIVGDSTVADYRATDPHRGWGQLFPEFVDKDKATVQNFAKNGRSTKTFLSEKRWDKALAWHPNFVYIQFGHNDSHSKDRPEATDATTDYPAFLRQYVDSARAAGAVPILVTPMHRANFTKDSPRRLTGELLPYADAMRAVAKEKNVPLIDLYARSGEAFEAMSPEDLSSLFAVTTDRTHFNEKGARLLARFVAEETGKVVPELRGVVQGN